MHYYLFHLKYRGPAPMVNGQGWHLASLELDVSTALLQSPYPSGNIRVLGNQLIYLRPVEGLALLHQTAPTTLSKAGEELPQVAASLFRAVSTSPFSLLPIRMRMVVKQL